MDLGATYGQTLRHVILPMLAATFENPALRNGDVVDAGVIQGLMDVSMRVPPMMDAR